MSVELIDVAQRLAQVGYVVIPAVRFGPTGKQLRPTWSVPDSGLCLPVSDCPAAKSKAVPLELGEGSLIRGV
ncbi:hypothetical protein A5648_04660 [Mycolicibacter sinensis]|uniref:Uncharacterized protein n=1 Tax=Mycolicibacter sinensis (strain JDM601) TaxID=875328 RepID=A0A1A3TWK1_MYCSD|nr:hypothetical protein A5648_04660 [Mycolicibacter sinensis]